MAPPGPALPEGVEAPSPAAGTRALPTARKRVVATGTAKRPAPAADVADTTVPTRQGVLLNEYVRQLDDQLSKPFVPAPEPTKRGVTQNPFDAPTPALPDNPYQPQ